MRLLDGIAKRLPNTNAIRGRQVKLVIRLNIESGVPGVEVGKLTVDAEVGRTMDVAHHLVAKRIVAEFRAPDLGVREEKPLIAGEAIENGRLPALQAVVVGPQGDVKTSQIADVLAQGVSPFT